MEQNKEIDKGALVFAAMVVGFFLGRKSKSTNTKVIIQYIFK